MNILDERCNISEVEPLAELEQHMSLALYTPIAPYFSNVYCTLLSIVQGIALAGLIDEFLKNWDRTFNLFLIKSSILFYVICFLWHRYISHTQYIAWRLKTIDTIIPFIFAILEGVMIKTTLNGDILGFSYFFAGIFLLGIFAYHNASEQHSKNNDTLLFVNHFRDFHFAHILHNEVENFEKKARLQMLYSCLFVVTQIVLNSIYDDIIMQIITLLGYIYLLIRLTLRDFRYALNHSQKIKDHVRIYYKQLENKELF